LYVSGLASAWIGYWPVCGRVRKLDACCAPTCANKRFHYWYAITIPSFLAKIRFPTQALSFAHGSQSLSLSFFPFTRVCWLLGGKAVSKVAFPHFQNFKGGLNDYPWVLSFTLAVGTECTRLSVDPGSEHGRTLLQGVIMMAGAGFLLWPAGCGSLCEAARGLYASGFRP